jgi:hypothetical protein
MSFLLSLIFFSPTKLKRAEWQNLFCLEARGMGREPWEGREEGAGDRGE